MNDLVKRLREGVADTGTLINTAANVNTTMAEAADRIEQLESAARMALDALGTLNSTLFNNDDDYLETRQHRVASEAITALREALEK